MLVNYCRIATMSINNFTKNTFAFLAATICGMVIAAGLPEISQQETLSEQKRGMKFLRLLWSDNLIVDDLEAEKYLQKLGAELAKKSTKPHKHFAFFVINKNEINAFAAPYGNIGVNFGLLLKSDSEAELAAVLAHEIAHVTQDHLKRFDIKTRNQPFWMMAGILAGIVAKDDEVKEAVIATTLAKTTQQSINFIREHEWEADRNGIKILKKTGFDPQGMADFFKKLKDDEDAYEFLRTHPLSINRIVDSLQRIGKKSIFIRQDSFTYLTVKARLYYHQYQRIQQQKNPEISKYMLSYQAFSKQKYNEAQKHINQLLTTNQTISTKILAGRIAAKLGQTKAARQFFNNKDDEASFYYAAKMFLDNRKYAKGIAILKPFLRSNAGSSASFELLAALYLKQGKLARAHIQKAKSLIIKGQLKEAIGQYYRAKILTNNQDLADVIVFKIKDLEQTIEIFKNLNK